MEIGTIQQFFSFSYEWKIHDFLDHLHDVDVIYESPDFEFESGTWYFRLYPNGKNKGGLSGWISIFMVKRSSEYMEPIFRFKFSIIDVNGDEYTCKSNTMENEFVAKDAELGCSKYLEISEVLKDKKRIAPEGELTCRIDIERSPAKRRDMVASNDYETCGLWQNFICNMKDLFLNQTDCDITIRVKDQEFGVHRIILEARCPILADMLQDEVKENRIEVLEITNAQPEVFREFLLYLYCGDVHITMENSTELYVLARKYDMQDLKQACIKLITFMFMIRFKAGAVEVVCDILCMAKVFGDMQIRKLAKDILIENKSTILGTDRWKEFETQAPKLAYETLKSISLDEISE